MNRTGRSRASRLSLPPLLLLLLPMALGLQAASEERTSGTTALADPDVLQLRSFFDDIFVGGRSSDGKRGNPLQTGRTFGHKRIQFMMMPMVYKMGVMMTMLAVLTVISLKGLMIGMILLVLKVSTIFGKFYALWHSHGHGHGHSSWTPPQPVHVHLHNSGPYETHSPAYHSWEPAASGPPDESYYYKG